MKKSAKILCAVLALVLTLSVGIGGTLAFLSLKTGEVKNTFTFGNLDLDLTEEHKGPFIFIPGQNLTKDPVVTVSTPEGYEQVPAYVFVKVVEGNWPNTEKISYSVDSSWTALESVDGVYYQEITPAKAPGTPLNVLTNKTVTVSPALTKSEVETLTASGKEATLTFTAYAIQKQGFGTALEAWKEVSATAELVTK